MENNTEKNIKNKSISIIVVIIILILAVWFVAQKKKAPISENIISSQETQNSSTVPTSGENQPVVESPTTQNLTPEQLKSAAEANDLGIKESGKGNYKGAVASFEKAHEISPNDPRFVRNLAIAYTYLKDYANAEKMFLLNFKNNPIQPEHWLELGELYYLNMKTPIKANSFYMEAIKQTNNNISVAQGYARFLEEEKKYTEAIKYWQIVADGVTTNRADFLKHIEELKLKL